MKEKTIVRFNLKSALYVFIYISFIFFIIYLWKSNFLHMPTIYSPPVFVLSFIFLIGALLGDCFNWGRVLIDSGWHVKFKEAAASVALTMLAKYIPGKVWMILGRSGYISAIKKYPLGQLSVLSLTAQLLNMWVGLFFGTIGVIIFDGLKVWGIMILSLLIFISLVIFSPFFYKLFEMVLNRLFKKSINIPVLNIKQTCRLLPWFIITWVIRALGFYMLAFSISRESIHLLAGMGFSLATNMGILAVIAPGGLGVREGVLAGYLHLTGINLEHAALISVTARLWFLIGEIIIFVLGIILDRMVKKKQAM